MIPSTLVDKNELFGSLILLGVLMLFILGLWTKYQETIQRNILIFQGQTYELSGLMKTNVDGHELYVPIYELRREQ